MQNTSHAVMAQRAEPHDSLDWFPTPLWATRALFEHCINVAALPVWDPACGCGAMARAIAEYAGFVEVSDVHDYGWGHVVHDFLQPFLPAGIFEPEWIVTNPPFRLAQQFVERGLEVAQRGVAVLVRSVFIESAGRYDNLFRVRPPSVMAQFVERVPMVKGRLDKKASTATSYCWLIWTVEPATHTKLFWIPPCRARLERPSDWPKETVPVRESAPTIEGLA